MYWLPRHFLLDRRDRRVGLLVRESCQRDGGGVREEVEERGYTVVGIDREAREIGGGDGKAQGMAGCDYVRRVPQVKFNLVNLSFLQVSRGDTILSPSHPNRIV